MRATLKRVKDELRRRMPLPIPEQGKWLQQVTTGFFAYHAVPTNSRALMAVSAPIWTVNWKANGGQQWTIPLGGGVGKIHFGKLPVNTRISAYYNVAKPDFGANWQIRAQMQFMFPKE